MTMTTAQIKRYDRLLAQATGFFRRDAEGKFKFAALLKEMVNLANDAKQVSLDLGMSGRSEVEGYIAILDFWGDIRIPDFPRQPARWGHYRNVVFNSFWHTDAKLQAKARAAALEGGNWAVAKLEQRLRAEQKEAAQKEREARPKSVKNAEKKAMRLNRLSMYLREARAWAGPDRDGWTPTYSEEERKQLLEIYEELTRHLGILGVITPKESSRRLKVAA